MNKKLLLSFLISSSFLVTSVSPVFALDYEVKRVKMSPEGEQAIKESIERRCAVSDARVTNVIGKYDTAYPMHVRNYKNVSQKVQEVVTKAKENGKDTSKLEATLRVLNEKIQTLDQQVAATIAQLKVAQQYACGESQGKYLEEIKKARQLAQTAHKTMQEIRSYYQSTVKPEVQALRSNR